MNYSPQGPPVSRAGHAAWLLGAPANESRHPNSTGMAAFSLLLQHTETRSFS